jgi:hypothetical protein
MQHELQIAGGEQGGRLDRIGRSISERMTGSHRADLKSILNDSVTAMLEAVRSDIGQRREERATALAEARRQTTCAIDQNQRSRFHRQPETELLRATA